MACCGRRRTVVTNHTSTTPTPLNKPQNYNNLTSTSNNTLCTRCGGNMRVQRTYISGEKTKANISCTSCGNVRIINI